MVQSFMLNKILGSETAMKIMLHLCHYGELYPSAVSKDYKISLSAVQKQFERFEDSGVLVSKLVGNTRVYFFNNKSPVTKPFKELIKVYYDSFVRSRSIPASRFSLLPGQS